MIRYYKQTVLILILLLFSFTSFSKGGYNIRVNISGYTDTTLLLTSYFGEKIKLVDTSYAVESGYFEFEGESKLAGGIYMVVSSDKKKLFEFIISEDQDFSFYTDSKNLVKNMKVVGSKDNEVFYEYLLNNEVFYQEIKKLNKEIDSISGLSEQTTILQSKRDSLNQQTIKYKLEVIDYNKGLFVSTLLNSMRDVEIPDSINNSTDSTLVFRYFKQHYWDNLALNDSCLLRTPVYMRKVKQYFNQAVVFNPDSVIVAIDDLITKARPSKEVVGYLVWYFISEYQNPKFMGFDKVFVHLVDDYFSKEEITNTTPSILTSLQERADKLRPILLDMPAPELLLIDSLGSLVSFRGIPNEYTVLFFWDSECGICGKEITELQKTYANPEYDIEVYAINVNGDLEKWKKAVIEKQVPGINVNGTRSATKDFHDLYDIYGTPVIYVLNKKKNIIAKRIGADKLEEFIDNYEKRAKQE